MGVCACGCWFCFVLIILFDKSMWLCPIIPLSSLSRYTTIFLRHSTIFQQDGIEVHNDLGFAAIIFRTLLMEIIDFSKINLMGQRHKVFMSNRSQKHSPLCNRTADLTPSSNSHASQPVKVSHFLLVLASLKLTNVAACRHASWIRQACAPERKKFSSSHNGSLAELHCAVISQLVCVNL